MAYNTGNPSGSSDPRDLSDSSADIDAWATSTTADTHPDRLGVSRKTWRGMENEFDADQSARASEFEADQDSRETQFVQLMISGGYTGTGVDGAVEEYSAGVTVSAYKEIIRENGEFWRAAADTELPYTTTGAGMPESGAFVNVGDGVLRQDLVQPVATFNRVSDMKSSAMLDVGRKARTLGYYEPGDGGGNDYEIVAAATGTADGGSFIDLPGGGLQAKAIFKYGAKPEEYGLEEGDTTNIPVSDRVADTRVFIDNLRQHNFHTSGATTNQHTFLLPDSKFRIAEASRSIDRPINACEKVLFVGDSLTAYIESDGTYTSQVVKKLQEIHGGIKEAGYLAAEPNNISAKQQFFGFSVQQSGFTYLSDGGVDYTDDRRKYSPDGKGITITGATGGQFYYWNLRDADKVRYTKYRVYYLQQPGGGTFDIRNRGASLNAVNTDGVLGLQAAEFNYQFNADEIVEYKDLRVENVAGNVTIYGVELLDENANQGFSWDVFAISGGKLAELMQLDFLSVRNLAASRGYDTIVINIGTNDSTSGQTPAQFESDLTGYLSRIQTELPNISPVIITPNNMQWTNFDGSTRAAYEDARRKFCRENDYMYIDLPSEAGNFNYFATFGWMRDGTHPNVKGQEVIGLKVAEKLIKNRQPIVIDSGTIDPLVNTTVIAYGSFYFDGNSLVVEANQGCTITRGGAGLYDVAFSDHILDNFYSVVINPNTANRNVFVSSQSESGFRIGYESLTNVTVDASSSLPFTVIGRKASRK